MRGPRQQPAPLNHTASELSPSTIKYDTTFSNSQISLIYKACGYHILRLYDAIRTIYDMSYQYKREPLIQEEATRLAQACKNHEERLVVWTLLDTGLRVGEFSSLSRDNIDRRRDQATGAPLCAAIRSEGVQAAALYASYPGLTRSMMRRLAAQAWSQAPPS